ncbi:MAG: hypothetical protein PHX61_01255 [Alphaproteobacteria bacterium]|nr:hypothetical protein [Alphaproteobacteria bacterium]
MKKSLLIYPLLAFSIASTNVHATPIFKYFNENGDPKGLSLVLPESEDKKNPESLAYGSLENIPKLTLIAKPEGQKPNRNNIGLFLSSNGSTHILNCTDLERGISYGLIAATKPRTEKEQTAIHDFVQNLQESRKNLQCPRIDV